MHENGLCWLCRLLLGNGKAACTLIRHFKTKETL